MEYKEIDYTKLKERIVEQAFASASYMMTEEQKQKLIQDKIERARVYSEQQKKFASYSIT